MHHWKQKSASRNSNAMLLVLEQHTKRINNFWIEAEHKRKITAGVYAARKPGEMFVVDCKRFSHIVVMLLAVCSVCLLSLLSASLQGSGGWEDYGGHQWCHGWHAVDQTLKDRDTSPISLWTFSGRGDFSMPPLTLSAFTVPVGPSAPHLLAFTFSRTMSSGALDNSE